MLMIVFLVASSLSFLNTTVNPHDSFDMTQKFGVVLASSALMLSYLTFRNRTLNMSLEPVQCWAPASRWASSAPPSVLC